MAVVATLVLVLLLPQLRADIDIRHQALARAVAGQVEAHLQGAARELRSLAVHFGNRSEYPASFWFASLDAHAGSGEVFAAIYIVDADDSVLAVGLPETQRSQRADLLQLDVSAWTSLQTARQHRQATWSETFLSTVSGRLAVTLAIPVDDRLLVGEIAVDQLAKFIASIPVESGMLIMIVDRRGQVIAHSQIELSGQQLSVGDLSIVGDALQGRFATGSFAWGGDSYVGTPVSIAQLDWIVVVAQPRKQALQPLLSTLWALAAGAVVAVLLAVAVAVLLSRAFARGLDRFAAQAHAIADGEYGQRWQTFRIREIDALTGDLDRMSRAIRQRERELAASEARYRSLISNLPVILFQFDERGGFTLCEGKGLERLRMTPGEVVGRSIFDLFGDSSTVGAHARRAVGGEAVRFATSFGKVPLEVYFNPLYDRDGSLQVTGVAVDITERKRMEEGLLDSEERFRLFMHHFPGLAYIKDADGRTLFANQGFRTYLGLSLDDMVGKTNADLFPAEFAEQLSDDDQRILASGQYEEREEMYAGRYWSTLKFPLSRPGRAPLLGGLALEISQRRLAEDALRGANRQLRMLSDCNQALIRTSDESDLLQTVCAITVDEGGYRMAWVGYKEADERRTVRPAAHAGNEDGYLQGIDLSWADDERGQGPMGTAIRTGNPCVVRNIRTDPRLASRHVEAARRGYAAVCALPLTVGDSVLGALAVYSSTTDAFADTEIDLLSELANDLAFGIAALRTRVERERATRALEESAFFLRKSQDVGDLGSYYFDVQTGTWISSEKLDQLFGIDDSFPKTTSGWIELVHPDHREEVLQHLTEDVLGRHNKFDREYRILRHDDGQERWMHGLGELEFDDRGMPRMMIGTIQDITRSKQADKALHESEERLQQAIRVSQLGIFDHDHRSDRIYWSPEQRLIHGWGADEPVTLAAFLASVHADDRPMIAAAVQRAHDPAGDGVYDVTHRIIRHGEVRWVVTRSQTIFAGQGTDRHPLRTVGADLDITDRKRTETELEHYREQLEELVAERTAELRQATEQLVQSEKLAALGHLVAGVAHELNTPLGNARVVASSLSGDLRALTLAVDSGAVRRSQLDAFLRRGREGLELLERNAARAADLIAQFKEVAVDQTSIRRRRFRLRQTVEELLLTLSPQFRHSSHRIELDIAPNIELDSYPGPLEQVLTNLVSNSLTHAFGDGRAGCIRIQAEATNPHLLVLRYRDDGAGIPVTAINRIFEPFFTTRLGQGGSGLGLYIVYNLVTGLLAGSIRVESSPGEGTAFTLNLPTIAPVRLAAN